MLELEIVLTPEGWDEEKQEFTDPETIILSLEHSLVSLSDWESKWCKPFLTNDEKTNEEIMDYIKCMTLTQNVDPKVYNYLSHDNFNKINNYIEAPMTATWFSENKKNGSSKEQITAELIYYWMIALQIPFECQKWHLNKLLTLIKVCNIKNQPPKKMSKRDIMRQNAAINAARRKQLNTKG